MTLNTRQRQALLLPFQQRLGLIEGPPGTGKTHLLAWMLIALLLEAAEAGRPLRLAVSALTHQAIDNVLLKVQQLLHEPVVQRFPGRCLKWGRRLSLADDTAEELSHHLCRERRRSAAVALPDPGGDWLWPVPVV